MYVWYFNVVQMHNYVVSFNQICFFSRYIDPTPFIQSLGLDSDQQQDAQEFSKLFTSLLEQQGGMTRAVIEQQFQGEYDYVTM